MVNLGDLGDVDLITKLPSHNNLLTYDGAKSKWTSKSSIITFEDWVIGGEELVIIIDEHPPEDITNLFVSKLDRTSLTLNWTASQSEDVKDYSIYFGTTLLGVVMGTTFEVTGLDPSTSYTFIVKSRDDTGNKSIGRSIEAKTLGTFAISMNGTSDFIKLKSLTFDSIELTCSIDPAPGKWNYYLDARNGASNGYLARNSAGNDWFGAWSAIYINGTLKTNNTPNITSNSKTTIRALLQSPVTDDINIFSNSSGKEHLKGIIYDIKLYNGINLIAHYDLTQQFSGTVIPDLSGNGKTATLYGGTWIS
ncbi:fibronectin type III domain-containing protein [Peribacillus sp. JNUCC 23]